MVQKQKHELDQMVRGTPMNPEIRDSPERIRAWQTRIRKEMAHINMTQAEFALAAGMARNSVESWLADPESKWFRRPSYLERLGALRLLRLREVSRSNYQRNRSAILAAARAKRGAAVVRPLQRWDDVVWDLSDSDIATALHVSRQAVAQQRKKRTQTP